MQVPQFLVQSESIANRATALQSASLFINGIIQSDQTWITDILSEQWYDPFVEKELDVKQRLEQKKMKSPKPIGVVLSVEVYFGKEVLV